MWSTFRKMSSGYVVEVGAASEGFVNDVDYKSEDDNFKYREGVVIFRINTH